jgi:hypothetical protein
MPGFPLARGSAWAGGRDHTPSRVPQRWDTTSCREAAPLTSLLGACGVGYSDAKVAHREIRVWHFVIENGY